MASENTYILQQSVSSRTLQDVENESVGSTQDVRQLIIEEPVAEAPKSSLSHTSFNYINSIIGSGIVGIPFALKQVGFGMGIILLLVIALATDYSLCILIKAANNIGVTTYQDLVHSAFGKPGYYFLSIIQFVYPLIAMISYNIIIGDTVTKVLRRIFNVSSSNLLGDRNFIIFIATLFVTLPLSLLRNIGKLSKFLVCCCERQPEYVEYFLQLSMMRGACCVVHRQL